MVLIIGNRHIKSRFRNKFSRLFVNSIQQKKSFNLIENNKTIFFGIMSLAAVLGTLFIYSVAMFTLPFIAFFGVQHLMLSHYHYDRFTSNCFAVAAAVIVVNLIIAVYVYRAATEPDDPAESNEIDNDDKIIDDNETHRKAD